MKRIFRERRLAQTPYNFPSVATVYDRRPPSLNFGAHRAPYKRASRRIRLIAAAVSVDDIRAWPGTTLTNETVLLIDLEPIAKTASETTLAKCEFQISLTARTPAATRSGWRNFAAPISSGS